MSDVLTAAPSAPASPSELGQDLTDCDREPIHIPGSIQPHGLLLVVEAAGLTVVGRRGRSWRGGWAPAGWAGPWRR